MISSPINSVKWLMENLKPDKKKLIKYSAFSLLSAPTHSSNLLLQSFGVDDRQNLQLQTIGKSEIDDFRNFIRATAITFAPIISIIRPLRTPTQQAKIAEVWRDYQWHYDRLYKSGAKIREDPAFRIQHLHLEKARAVAETQRIAQEVEAAETEILRNYADKNRKYPIGYRITIDGKSGVINKAKAYVSRPRTGIIYEVLLDNGHTSVLDQISLDRILFTKGCN